MSESCEWKLISLSRRNVRAATAWLDPTVIRAASATTLTLHGSHLRVAGAFCAAYAEMTRQHLPRRGGDFQLLHAARRRFEAQLPFALESGWYHHPRYEGMTA